MSKCTLTDFITGILITFFSFSMFAMFFNVVFAVFVCYPAAFCQLCFYNKDWIDWIGSDTAPLWPI